MSQHRERERKYRRTPKGRARWLYHRARSRAVARGLPFKLTVDWILARLEAGYCELSGDEFYMGTGREGKAHRAHPFSPSIDRISPDLGYTPDNCRLITTRANRAISEWGVAQFERFAIQFLMARRPGLFVLPKRPRARAVSDVQDDLFIDPPALFGLRALGQESHSASLSLGQKPSSRPQADACSRPSGRAAGTPARPRSARQPATPALV